MYETLMQTLRAFFGTGILKLSLFASLALAVVVLAALCSPAFRGSLMHMREQGGWRGTLAEMGAGLFKLAVIFFMARLLISALNYQAAIFEQQHGRITERNRSAVLMKWGHPHEQRELAVHHTRSRTRVTRQLLIEESEGRERIFTETFWKDQERPIQAINGKLPVLLSAAEEEEEVPVEQKSIVSAEVSVTVTNDPRRLGNANYAGYDDVWKFRYVVKNKSPWQTRARMSMPLPASTGLFDRMYLKVGGADLLDSAYSEDNEIVWSVGMDPGERETIEFGYASRGLEHLRYIPRRMSQTGHYRVTMNVNGIPPDKLDYPIGSMPPAENLPDLSGNSYALTWNLDNAMTSYDVGIKLPVARQPRYYFAHLLEEAPVGLILLILLLVVPAVISGGGVSLQNLVILAALYCLHYAFMGRLADLMPGFAGPFLISAAVIIALVAWFRSRGGAGGFLARQDSIAFAIMATAYPLAIIDSERTALWMVLLYLLMAAYACLLLVSRRRSSRGQ